MMENERHYEVVSVKQGGKRRMEGQAKLLLRSWMSRRPNVNVSVSPSVFSFSLSHNMIGTLRCGTMAILCQLFFFFFIHSFMTLTLSFSPFCFLPLLAVLLNRSDGVMSLSD